METIKTILDNYTAADDEQRLYMFLRHRDLRDEFTEIDMATLEPPSGAQPKQIIKMQSERRSWGLSNWCWGWFKHCRLTKLH